MVEVSETMVIPRRALMRSAMCSTRRCKEDSMVSDYPRGSEWRKWDLHLHAQGTKLVDGYTPNDGRPDLEQFCQIVHDSDVAVIAVTDYFSLDGYFDVREKYSALYPRDNLLILPNLELRLSVAVNRQDQEVNLHLIFRPSLTRAAATKFLSHLKTAATVGASRTPLLGNGAGRFASSVEWEIVR
jgi:hypothetical protein